jgi:hypothetical protein
MLEVLLYGPDGFQNRQMLHIGPQCPVLGVKSGYHRTYIGQLEREKSPSLRTIFNLAKTLQVGPPSIV